MADNSTLQEVAAERLRQEVNFPNQHLPDGTDISLKHLVDKARLVVDMASKHGALTWSMVLAEEFYEALSESCVVKLRKELIQVAAVAVRWIEDIDHGR
jgi:hypothetical protein